MRNVLLPILGLNTRRSVRSPRSARARPRRRDVAASAILAYEWCPATISTAATGHRRNKAPHTLQRDGESYLPASQLFLLPIELRLHACLPYHRLTLAVSPEAAA